MSSRSVGLIYLTLAVGLLAVGGIVSRLTSYKENIVLNDGYAAAVYGSVKNFEPKAESSLSKKGQVLGASTEVKRTAATAAPAMSKDYIVRFMFEGYVPKEIHVNRGDSVIFRNENDNLGTRPVAIENSEGKIYPGPGRCGETQLDPCQAISIGGSWSMQFDESGRWVYQDQMNPAFIGTVVVE